MRLKTKTLLNDMVSCVHLFLSLDIGSWNRPTNEHTCQQAACVIPVQP